ncbi:MAG: hypothetical protein K6T74_14980 [Geminicoccaceae bacterium]|nr:hypothetical protein [Geminicoccaceae bacterium]
MVVAAGFASAAIGGGVGTAILVEAPGNAAADLVYAGSMPVGEGLRRLVESREAALHHTGRPRGQRDLAMVLLAAAERAESADLAREAEARFAEALMLAPADPVAWSMIPHAALWQGDGERALEWLRAGIRVVPYAPEYAPHRLAALVGSRRPLDGVLQEVFDRDLVTALQAFPLPTAQLLRDQGVLDRVQQRFAARAEVSRLLARAVEALEEAEESGRR